LNIYTCLNEVIEYIENNLENDINYSKMAQIMASNEYTVKKVFSLISNISISEYIRNRRLSNAGFDLYKNNEKIIDIAIKYQYDNPTSFSRAFEKFHGIKPSLVNNNPEKLKVYPKLHFNEEILSNDNMEYSIIKMEELVVYGKGIKTTYSTINDDAPRFFADMRKRFLEKYGEIDYGMVIYEDRCDGYNYNYEYWIAYNKKIDEFEKIIIPQSKWLRFRINSQEAVDIQKVSRDFYEKFITSSKFNLRELPELEYYHNDITDFLVPIED